MATPLETCSFRLDRRLVAELKDASSFLSDKFGRSRVTSIACIVNAAIRDYLAYLAKKHNKGRRFPARARGLVLLQSARKKRGEKATSAG